MELNFVHSFHISDEVRQHEVGHEPNNTIVDYFIEGLVPLVKNQGAVPAGGIYTGLTFQKENFARVPPSVYKFFGIKTHPRIGAYGFFRHKYTPFTDILVPINVQRKVYTPPDVTITIEGNNVIFTMVDPADVAYECYRVVMRNGYFAEEYITYEKTLKVRKPYPDATYDMYVIGYRTDGLTSTESTHQAIVITGSINPVPPTDIASNVPAVLSKKFDDAKYNEETGMLEFYSGATKLDEVVLPKSSSVVLPRAEEASF